MVYTKSAIVAAALSIAAIITPVAAKGGARGHRGARIAFRPDGPSWEEIQQKYPPNVLKSIREEPEELEARSPRNIPPIFRGHPFGPGPVMIPRPQPVTPIARAENDAYDIQGRSLGARDGAPGQHPKMPALKRPHGRRPHRRPHQKRPGMGRPGKGKPGKVARPGQGRPRKGRPGMGRPGQGKPQPPPMPKPVGMPQPGNPNLPGKIGTTQPSPAPPSMPPPSMPPSSDPSMSQGMPSQDGGSGGASMTSGSSPSSSTISPENGSPANDPAPSNTPAMPGSVKRDTRGFIDFLVRRGYLDLDELD